MHPPRIDRKVAKDGQFYFVVIGGNGEPQVVSEMYPTQPNRDRGVEDFLDTMKRIIGVTA